MLIRKDGQEWFNFQVNDELEGWSWSPKQNYLLLNYYNKTLPELVDTKERKRLPIPTAEGILGPSIRKGTDGEIIEDYVEGIRAKFEWNSQEDQAIVYLSDTGTIISWPSTFYWNLKNDQYHYYSILSYEDSSLQFDKAGNLMVVGFNESVPSGKWLNDIMIMAADGDDRSSSFASDWGGWAEESSVNVYGINGSCLTPIGYRAYDFDIFSKNNRFGYEVNYTTHEIEKYRFRWFSLLFR